MNHFLNSFGISNYIRQMMCGIIYFIPFFLFARNSTAYFLKDGQGDWSSTKLLVVAVVAACIGTLIYHVEKNLLGYSSQVFRAWCKNKYPHLPVWMALVVMLGASFLFVAIVWGYKGIAVKIPTECCIFILVRYCFFVILPLFLLGSALHANLGQQKNSEETERAFDKTVEETRNAWRAASVRRYDTESSSQLREIQEIAERESNWADFIHCGQTSAISWILGSITATYLNQTNYNSDLFWCGISIALWLLGFEFFCEWHKSLHIDYMIRQYQSPSEK